MFLGRRVVEIRTPRRIDYGAKRVGLGTRALEGCVAEFGGAGGEGVVRTVFGRAPEKRFDWPPEEGGGPGTLGLWEARGAGWRDSG